MEFTAPSRRLVAGTAHRFSCQRIFWREIHDPSRHSTRQDDPGAGAPGVRGAAARDAARQRRRRHPARRRLRQSCRRRGPHRLRHQHRLRPAGPDPHRPRQPGRAAALAGAVPRHRRGRAHGRRPGAPDHGAQGQQPGTRLLRHPPRSARRPARPGQRRGLPAHPAQGLRRRLRRPGAARPHERGAARRRQGTPSRRMDSCPSGPRDRRAPAAAARAQGGPGAAQRHPGLHHLRPERPVRGRRPVRRRHGVRRTDGGSHAQLTLAVRCPHPRRPWPARPDRCRRRLPSPAR